MRTTSEIKVPLWGGNLKVPGSQVWLSLQQPEQTLILENSIRIAKLYFNRVLCAPSAEQKGRAS